MLGYENMLTINAFIKEAVNTSRLR
jgi:hypothetical protein